MSDTVVDSSVVAKWILPDADSTQAQRLITEIALKGERLIVLDLALVEVANAIWKRYHRGLATQAETAEFLKALLRCPVHIEPTLRLLGPALGIAVQHDRAVYDALFIALAEDLKIVGVTADEPWHQAVQVAHPQFVLLRDW